MSRQKNKSRAKIVSSEDVKNIQRLGSPGVSQQQRDVSRRSLEEIIDQFKILFYARMANAQKEMDRFSDQMLQMVIAKETMVLQLTKEKKALEEKLAKIIDEKKVVVEKVVKPKPAKKK